MLFLTIWLNLWYDPILSMKIVVEDVESVERVECKPL
jgi:hypothetical protein